MKLSKLIDQLQEILEEEGDLTVQVSDDDGRGTDVEDVFPDGDQVTIMIKGFIAD